jgi:hypothetical protein
VPQLKQCDPRCGQTAFSSVASCRHVCWVEICQNNVASDRRMCCSVRTTKSQSLICHDRVKRTKNVRVLYVVRHRLNAIAPGPGPAVKVPSKATKQRFPNFEIWNIQGSTSSTSSTDLQKGTQYNNSLSLLPRPPGTCCPKR